MAGKRLKKCRKGLHKMTDPANVKTHIRDGKVRRECRACCNARHRLGEAGLRLSQIEILQRHADGLSVEEIAEERGGIQPRGVVESLERIRRRLGVESNAAAVAVGLKLGVITPDGSGPLPSMSDESAPHVAYLLDVVNGRRKPYGANSGARKRLLDVLYAWSEPHAVSVLWAAGLIKARDVQLQRGDGTDAKTTRLL